MDTNGVSTSEDATGRAAAVDSGADVRTFLIVDVRGYTHFTQTLGDEEAARLAASFAALARKTVAAMGGEVIELRGDEALCVFRSARQALRAAVELQVRFRERVNGQPVFPLGIGIGLDAGEAVPVEGGYRGGALNLAARLCGLAAPGEILASETVTSLARRLEGMRFVERRGVRVKGLEKRVRVIEVVPETELPPVPEAPMTRSRARRPLLIGLGGALLGLAAAVTGIFLTRGGDSAPTAVAANSVAVIDPGTNTVVDTVPVGEGPGPIAVHGDSLWVVNVNDRTLMKIDPARRSVVTSVGLPTPTGFLSTRLRLAVAAGYVWVYACHLKLLRIDPGNGQIVQEVEVFREIGAFAEYSCAVAADAGSVWVPIDFPSSVLIRVATPEDAPASVAERISLPGGFRSAIALGAGSVWVADRQEGALLRIDPATGAVTKTIPLDAGPSAMAFAYGAVWVVNERESSVSRIRPRTNSIVYAIPVGEDPVGIAVGAGALWVANSGNGTVSRIDPETNTVTATIDIGNRPLGIAVGDGLVWVTVRA
jgi:YVTN family beta-propeller protein